MGIILCRKHGEQFFIEVCRHYFDAFDQDIIIDSSDKNPLHIKICRTCYEELSFKEIENISLEKLIGLPPSKITKIESLIHQKYDLLETRAICSKCHNHKTKLKAK